MIDIYSKKAEKVYNNIIDNFSNQCLPNMLTNTLLFETIDHHIDIHYKKINKFIIWRIQHSSNG